MKEASIDSFPVDLNLKIIKNLDLPRNNVSDSRKVSQQHNILVFS